MAQSPRFRVVIAGGGVAGLEALIGIHALAGERVELTLVAPQPAFAVRALTVQEPFGSLPARPYPLAALCEACDARFVRAPLAAVDVERRMAGTPSGAQLPYDALLVAFGTRALALPGAVMFRGGQDAFALRTVLGELDAGGVRRVAFVLPPGHSWPVPLYELALLTAARAPRGAELTVVTSEAAPLEGFGPEATHTLAGLLADARVDLRAGKRAAAFDGSAVVDADGNVLAAAERAIAVPRLEPIHVAGLPTDPEGFLPTSPYGAVRAAPHVYAAGDCTAHELKQGGLAAQQADAAARTIAEASGAPVVRRPYRPVLRAQLFTAAGPVSLRHDAESGDSTAIAGRALWWPPAKVAAPRLAPVLEALDAGRPPAEAVRAAATSPVHVIHAEGDPAGGIEVLPS